MARRRTEEEWSRICTGYETSGMTITAYAARVGTSKSTMSAKLKAHLHGRIQDPVPTPRWPAKGSTPVTQPAMSRKSLPAVEGGTVVIALEHLAAHIVVDEETDLGQLQRVLAALAAP